MLWTSNICRICARISDVCIPIFEGDATTIVETKITRCLSPSVSKDDLKPKQICRDCFVKLTEFYNFIALYHESNYRFETLLYQSTTQNSSGALPTATQGCVGRSVDLDLSIAGGQDNLIESKPEDLSDCANLDLIAEYKDSMLPLENLDVQARDFGEQNILNEMVEQATGNQVDIDMHNFVSGTDAGQIYGGISGNSDSNLTVLKVSGSGDANYLGKLRSLQTYFDAQNTQIDLVGGEAGFVKSKDENQNVGKNTIYLENVYAEDVGDNPSNDVRPKSNVGKKRNSKLNVISVDAIRRALESEKQLKFEMVHKSKLHRCKKINNNSVGKAKVANLNIRTRDLMGHNNLNEIESRVVDIASIDVEKLVSGNDNQIYAGIGDNLTALRDSNNHNLNKIDDIQFLDLEQNLVAKSEEEKPNIRNIAKDSQDPLALEYCSYSESCYAQALLNDCNNTKIKNAKKRTKLKIVSVKDINKITDIKELQDIKTIVSKKNKSKEITKYEIIPIKPRLNRNRNKNKEFGENPLADHTKKRYPCTKCDKSFARQQYYNEHLKKHNSLRPYVCEVCDKPFAIQWDLTFHKRIHTGLYSCEHCSKCFSAPSKLQRHIRIHTGERPFVCLVEDCGRSFSDKRNLMGHQITHTNVRKFPCDVCKRSYKTKSQLKDHMQAHSDSPAFKCDRCDKSYRWKTNLLIHVKKHIDNVKYLIPIKQEKV